MLRRWISKPAHPPGICSHFASYCIFHIEIDYIVSFSRRNCSLDDRPIHAINLSFTRQSTESCCGFNFVLKIEDSTELICRRRAHESAHTHTHIHTHEHCVASYGKCVLIKVRCCDISISKIRKIRISLSTWLIVCQRVPHELNHLGWIFRNVCVTYYDIRAACHKQILFCSFRHEHQQRGGYLEVFA